MIIRIGLVLIATGARALAGGDELPEWTHLSKGPSREGQVVGLPVPIASPWWVAAQDRFGHAIAFSGQSGPVAIGERVFAVGSAGGQDWVFAIDMARGRVAWQAPIPAPSLDSFSTPAIDRANGTILVASGNRVTCLELRSGAELWRITLARNIVNSSPLVTSDRLRADRALITDYDGFGTSGRLYCLNVDRFDPVQNPYVPGEIVWSAVIGTSAGGTPAYDDGVVYIGTAGDYGIAPGEILAFDVSDGSTPIWRFENVIAEGFYGGVCVRRGSGGTGVYAASYGFYGGQFDSNLVKLDAATGALAWSVGCNRTRSTPVVLGDGLIVLSTGIDGFGSVPSIQAFREARGTVSLLWDSALETWDDRNDNGVVESGEYLAAGGWCHQPVVAESAGARFLLTGIIPLAGDPFGACTDMYMLDLREHPASPEFIAGHFEGAGSSPAVVGRNAYTIGVGGLHAFGIHWGLDVDGDGFADADDVRAWEQGSGERDVDLDGEVTEGDHELLIDSIHGLDGARSRVVP